MIISGFLTKSELIGQVSTFVEQKFKIPTLRTEDQLTPVLDNFIDDLVVYVEYPYVEKFYRDTYYHFYSMKYNQYDRNCIRLSFFKDIVEEDHIYSGKNPEIAKDNYLGYITLRPTSYNIIGNSFLSPNVLKIHNFVCCQTKKEILLRGYKLSIQGFSYATQDKEFITCSETSLLNLIEYFGTKYAEFSVLLPSQIVKILSKQSFERQLPSKGMQTEYISFTLKKLGFGTVVYSLEDGVYSWDELKKILYIYIESGLPFIANLSTGKNHHSVLVIGRENIDSDVEVIDKKDNHKNLTSTIKKVFEQITGNPVDNNSHRNFYFSDFFDKLLVMNDGAAPYQIVSFDNPLQAADNKSYSIKSIIVPLFPKVHLEAFQLMELFPTVLKQIDKLGDDKNKITSTDFLNPVGDNIFRHFLTSCKSYKSYLSKLDSSSKFIDAVIDKSMPRYVWIIEVIFGRTLHKKQDINSIFIIDATESGYDHHLIFASNSNYTIVRSYDKTGMNSVKYGNLEQTGTYHYLEFGLNNISIFADNLIGNHNHDN